MNRELHEIIQAAESRIEQDLPGLLDWVDNTPGIEIARWIAAQYPPYQVVVDEYEKMERGEPFNLAVKLPKPDSANG